MNRLINNEGVCRTALAKPGLLNIYKGLSSYILCKTFIRNIKIYLKSRCLIIISFINHYWIEAGRKPRKESALFPLL